MTVRADDFIVGFQHREEAERFLAELRERLAKFSLELHPEKTRLLEFGPYAAEHRGRAGEGKPETFDFLGFTHICGRKRNGRFTVVRQTIRKRVQAKLSEVKTELRRRLLGADAPAHRAVAAPCAHMPSLSPRRLGVVTWGKSPVR